MTMYWSDDETANSRTIQSVETMCRIVDTLQARNGARITTLADDLGLSRSTVHTHLATLYKNEFVVKDNNIYRLGLRFLDVGNHVRKQFPGGNQIQTTVHALSKETGEFVQFITEERGHPVVLYSKVGSDDINMRTHARQQLYLHQMAAGKAILAHLPEHRVDTIVDRHGLPPATEDTITNIDALRDDLSTTRKRGVSFSYGESTQGINAVAAPIFASDNSILGAIAIAGSKHRLTGDRLEEDLSGRLRSQINKLEHNLAYEE